MYAGAEPQDPPPPPPPYQEGDPVHADIVRRRRATSNQKSASQTRREQIAALEEIWYPFETPAIACLKAPSALQSHMPVSSGEVTIVTQCSLDRLDRLEAMSRSWSGLISCAVHVPDLACEAEAMAQLISLHARVEAMGKCRLFLTTLVEDLAGFPVEVAGMYPINKLRNGERCVACVTCVAHVTCVACVAWSG
mmetsp:Transcript_23212/g.62157  ORF Transcript_23212/g.62157 Transcript_23212/m.62157 type:complete len:194 (-) Transcript_23212:820-1401(-)